MKITHNTNRNSFTQIWRHETRVYVRWDDGTTASGADLHETLCAPSTDKIGVPSHARHVRDLFGEIIAVQSVGRADGWWVTLHHTTGIYDTFIAV